MHFKNGQSRNHAFTLKFSVVVIAAITVLAGAEEADLSPSQ